MKKLYVVFFIVGLILSLFCFVALTAASIDLITHIHDPQVAIHEGVFFIVVFFYGLFLAVGILLCVFSARKLRKAKLKYQVCKKCGCSLEPGWTSCQHCGEKVLLTK